MRCGCASPDPACPPHTQQGTARPLRRRADAAQSYEWMRVGALPSARASTHPQKATTHECGFDPFGHARAPSDVAFHPDRSDSPPLPGPEARPLGDRSTRSPASSAGGPRYSVGSCVPCEAPAVARPGDDASLSWALAAFSAVQATLSCLHGAPWGRRMRWGVVRCVRTQHRHETAPAEARPRQGWPADCHRGRGSHPGAAGLLTFSTAGGAAAGEERARRC